MYFFFFKQKTAYDMRISDWSSDVCFPIFPKHLTERFPDEMTIVIQNRFWDLKVREDGFEVGLSFNQAPAKLVIPFSAITGFVAPAVNFALQFHAQAEEAGPQEHEAAENDSPAAEPAADGSHVESGDLSRKQ